MNWAPAGVLIFSLVFAIGHAESSADQVSQAVIALGEEPPTFDYPHFPGTAQSSAIVNLVQEALVHLDQAGKVQPRLAESWEISADGLVWTFHLRRGVKFHDGTPFNAEAVRFQVERLTAEVDPYAGKRSVNQYAWKHVARVRVVDEYTVQFVTRQPYAPFANAMMTAGGGIASPAAVKKAGGSYGMRPAGTGPYKMVEWVRGERIVLARNPDYWRTGERVDRIIFRNVPDATARTLGLIAGDFDVVGDMPPAQVANVRNNPGTGVIATPISRVVWLIPNFRHESPFGNALVRRATNLSIDRDAIAKHVLNGFAKVADSVISERAPGYARIGRYEYDPKRARLLLAQSGFPQGFATRIAISPQVAQSGPVIEAVQAFLLDVGIRAEIVRMTLGSFFGTMRQAPEQFGLWLFAWSLQAGDADTLLIGCFHSSSIPLYNAGGYANPEMDRLLDQQRATISEAKRYGLIADILRMIRDQDLAIPIFVDEALVGAKLKVRGIWVAPSGVLGFENLQLKP